MKYNYAQIKKLFLVGKQNPRIIMELAEDDRILVSDGSVVLPLPQHHKLFTNTPYAHHLPTTVGLPREFRSTFAPDTPYKDLDNASNLLYSFLAPVTDEYIELRDTQLTVNRLDYRARVFQSADKTDPFLLTALDEKYLSCLFLDANITHLSRVMVTTKAIDGTAPVTLSVRGTIIFFLMPLHPNELQTLHILVDRLQQEQKGCVDAA